MDDDEYAEVTDVPPERKPMDTEAVTAVPGASSDPIPSSTRVHEHLPRLEAVMAGILKNQAWILEHLDCIQHTLDEDIDWLIIILMRVTLLEKKTLKPKTPRILNLGITKDFLGSTYS